jgi:hypothetical protein
MNTFTITITGDQLDMMQAYLQNDKINTNEFERSVAEDQMLDSWLASLAAAVPTGN